jgi:hypothetical protein
MLVLDSTNPIPFGDMVADTSRLLRLTHSCRASVHSVGTLVRIPARIKSNLYRLIGVLIKGV